MNIMCPADQGDILVRLHPFFFKKESHSTIYTSIDDVTLSDQSQRLLSAHTNPLTLFGGVVLTTPQLSN